MLWPFQASDQQLIAELGSRDLQRIPARKAEVEAERKAKSAAMSFRNLASQADGQSAESAASLVDHDEAGAGEGPNDAAW